MSRALAWLGPDFGLVFAFMLVDVALIAAYGGSYKWQEGPIVISAGIAVLLIGIAGLWRLPRILRKEPGIYRDYGRSAKEILRDWGPLILIMWCEGAARTSAR